MDNAREYVASGMRLVKIPRGSKAPKLRAWNQPANYIDTPEKADLINGDNAGLLLAPSRMCTVDVDNYLAAIDDMERRGIDLPALLMADDAVQISSGRENRAKLLYRLPAGIEPPQTVQFLDDNKAVIFELRCASKDGTTVQDVIPPSIHPDTGKPYTWIGDWHNIPTLPSALWTMWQARINEERRPGPASQAQRKKNNGGQHHCSVVEGGRNSHLASLAGAMRRKGMTPTAIEAALQAENTVSCHPPLPSDEVAVIARSIGRYTPDVQPQQQQAPPPATTNWRDELVMKDELRIHPKSQKNACIFLKMHPQMRGVFARNEFSISTEVVRRPPWGSATQKLPRQLADEDITLATAWLETHGIFVSSAIASSAIAVAASYMTYDPLKDWINGLKWDRKPRLTGWVSRLLGAESNQYTEVVGRKFLIGAIARGLVPGCKMDTMLILEGAQGAMKSTAIRALFSQEWFTDEIHAIGSKDAAMQLQGNWGVEISEMHAMGRAEANQIKEWISRSTDKYRPPYGRCVIEAPRRCVLVGTLNPEAGYLKDPTGGRRFWPIKCHRIDLQAVEEEREQLFAEAAAAYRADEPWWLSDAETKLAVAEQEERYEGDPWGDAIDAYIELREMVTTAEVMEFALDLKERDWTKSAEMRIAKHLVSIGWKREKRRVGGMKPRNYFVKHGLR